VGIRALNRVLRKFDGGVGPRRLGSSSCSVESVLTSIPSKRLREECPVRPHCFDYADNKHLTGMWGGKNSIRLGG
jgi:hypothetical protein